MSSLKRAEAALLRLAERTTSQSVIRKLQRAARSLFWSESPGRPPIDDTEPIEEILQLMATGTRKPTAIRTVSARRYATEADEKRWRRKLPK